MDYNKSSSNSTTSNTDKNNKISCIGCRDGILNQLGHMESGGCLYDNCNDNDNYNDDNNDTDEN